MATVAGYCGFVTTYNDTKVMVRYFVDSVKEVGIWPSLVRTDCGTENVVITGVQSFLRTQCNDVLASENAHRYGPSTGNQRIEASWSYFRLSRFTCWINFLIQRPCRPWSVLPYSSALCDECLWFCFAVLIQQDLDFVKIHWNTHYIFASQDIIHAKSLENQINYIFSQKTLVPQTSCNQYVLKS